MKLDLRNTVIVSFSQFMDEVNKVYQEYLLRKEASCYMRDNATQLQELYGCKIELEEEDAFRTAESYNREIDERNRISAENREKPWLPQE